MGGFIYQKNNQKTKHRGEGGRMSITVEQIKEEIERRIKTNGIFISKMESLNIKKNAILQSNTLLNLLKWVNEKEQEDLS